MNRHEMAQYCLDTLKKNGADKAQCSITETAKHELNIDAGAMSLFRTTFNTIVSLLVIKDGKKGTLAINKTDKDALNNAIVAVMELAQSSNADDANDIADVKVCKQFTAGDDKPQLDRMYERFQEFLAYNQATYPFTNLEQSIFDFTKTENVFMNSHGVDFTVTDGIYNFNAMFTSKDGEKMSSFNGTGASHRTLDIPLKEWGAADRLLKESAEQITTQSFADKFVGDVIITPFALGDFIGALAGVALDDFSLITKTSPYMEKLNQKIASDVFTLHSRPVSGEIEDGYYYTGDGFEAQNMTIIDKGVLKSYLLGLYGAKKTGRARSVNVGGAFVVDPGHESFETLVKSVKRGIILGRFSGGNPNDNGDFSGVAKNSYYIENGKIQFPITETMIAGNVIEMMLKIRSISAERINFGSAIFPWVVAEGITISGK